MQTEPDQKPVQTDRSGSVKSGFLGKKPGNLNPNPDPPTQNSTWSFSSLIQTLVTKSESVIEIYKKDLEEFGSGLKNESVIIRDVAWHVVHDLPASFEAIDVVAQEYIKGWWAHLGKPSWIFTCALMNMNSNH